MSKSYIKNSYLNGHLFALEFLINKENVQNVNISMQRIMIHICIVEVTELNSSAPLPSINIDLGYNLNICQEISCLMFQKSKNLGKELVLERQKNTLEINMSQSVFF